MMWRRAGGTDVPAIMDLTREHFRSEATDIWTIDEQHFARMLTVDIVNQFFNPNSALVAVLEREGRLLAYVWAERNQRTVWSSQEMIAIKIVHLDLTLSARERIRIITEMMELWEAWAYSIGVNIVCSSTMRGEQDAFLKLHQRRGYLCRGSICYRRLTDQQAGQETDHGHQGSDHADV